MNPDQQRLEEAKARAASIRQKKETFNFQEYGFSSAIEFVQYHWEKLSEKDREELRRVGIEAPLKEMDKTS